jgi:hypothetical protein
MSLPDTSRDDDFTLRPLECRSREELERELADPILLPEAPPPPRPWQFSIGDVMFLMVGGSIGLAGGSTLWGHAFEFALGLVTLSLLVIFQFHPPQTHAGRLVLTAVLIAYFSALLAAAIRPTAALF